MSRLLNNILVTYVYFDLQDTILCFIMEAEEQRTALGASDDHNTTFMPENSSILAVNNGINIDSMEENDTMLNSNEEHLVGNGTSGKICTNPASIFSCAVINYKLQT